MLEVYRSAEIPPFLDARARDLLAEGRDTFARFELGENSLLPRAGGSLLFPWKGDRVLDTLVIWLSALGFGVAREGVALVFSDASPDRVREELTRLAGEPAPDAVALAAAVANKRTEKFHPWLSDGLLTLDFASRGLDVAGAWGAGPDHLSAKLFPEVLI
jgi:ATP-dependent Lhr-like helicase